MRKLTLRGIKTLGPATQLVRNRADMGIEAYLTLKTEGVQWIFAGEKMNENFVNNLFKCTEFIVFFLYNYTKS